jgi:NAD(P)-dependent dehydrogenase (short-subunit alcohol dehydrogenase family)
LHAEGGAPYLFAYAVSKGGVVTLTRNLARALAPRKIRVNCVHSGWVSTEGELELRRGEGWSDSWVEEEGRQLPFGRLQIPADVASTIIFLSSDEASQVTGQVIAVDGGIGLG